MERSSSTSGVVIRTEDDTLKVSVKFGCCPTSGEVNSLVGVFILEYTQVFGPVEVYKRKNPYRFVFRQGVSGCQDTYVEVDMGDGFPSRKKILHMSMCGKVNEGINCFVYDFLDLAVSENYFKIVDGNYVYDLEKDSLAESMEVKVVRPRLTKKEPGWNEPGTYGKVQNLFEEGVIVKTYEEHLKKLRW